MSQAERQAEEQQYRADPITGKVKGRVSPNAKLTPEAVLRIKQLIVAGEHSSDEAIAETVVAEGWALSDTGKAVSYWRNHPETQRMLASRMGVHLNSGFANRSFRVGQLNKIATALVRDVFREDRATGELHVRDTESPADRMAQVQLMGQIGNTIKLIGDICDADAKFLKIDISGTVNHTAAATSLGLSNLTAEEAREKMRKLLAEAEEEMIDSEFTILPNSVGSKKV